MNLKGRIERLERATAPVDLSKLTDAELDAILDAAPAHEKSTLLAMTGEELETLLALPPGEPCAAFFETMLDKYWRAR